VYVRIVDGRQLMCVQAEQFNDAIQVVRNWLPEAEAELKLHSIPDDEESILQAIDNHEVLHVFCSQLLCVAGIVGMRLC